MDRPFQCIAIDMGAATIRLHLGIIEDQKISYREIYRFKNEIKIIDRHDRWDIDQMMDGILKGINQAIEESNYEIKSIGIDSWGVDFAILSSDGHLLEVPVSYRDSRTKGMEEAWLKLMSKKETFERTGINFYSFNTLFQLLSLKSSGLLQNASRILFMPNYIYFRLSGHAANELTISSTSQLLEIGSTKWDEKIIQLVGVRPGQLGDVVLPGHILGPVTHSSIIQRNIQAVNVCSHDTASAIAAIPADKPGFAFIATGTWCITGLESAFPVISDSALANGFTNERGYDNSYRVLKNILGLWLVQGLQKTLPVPLSFDDMEKLAMEEKYAGYYIDPGNEMFFNPGNMYEAFIRFFQLTNQRVPDEPGFFVKCAYNSLCLSFKDSIEEMEQMVPGPIEVIHMIGGGCQSEYLCRTTAGLCGRRVIAGPVEAAGIGNIMVQGIAMKKIKDIAEGRRMIKNSFDIREYDPMMSPARKEEMSKKSDEIKKLSIKISTHGK